MFLSVIKKYWPYIVLSVASVLIIWPTLMPGYFSHHDDLQVMRIFEMRRCILDFQIPCRWVPDMGWGNGYPLFNYYAVLPYYIGAVLSFFVGFIQSAKLLFLIPLVLSGISMYIFAREFSSKFASLAAATLYMFAPYKALDSYVRGDVAEMFATSIIPLVLYFLFRLIKTGNTKFMVGLSLGFAAFLLSHNIMSVLFTPVILTLVVFWLFKERFNNFKPVVLGLLIGVGLAAFFIFPAYFEKELVQIDNLTKLDLNFRAHFVTVNQLFLDRSWGYGASKPGIYDTISFQLGWPHWLVVLASIFTISFGILRNRNKNSYGFYFITLAIFLFSIFMTHIRSAFIWEAIPVLRFTQFPWRFLAVTVFSASLIGALFIQNLPGKIQKYISSMVIVIAVALNWNYFQPQMFYPDLTDQDKLSGDLWETQQKAAILDYLPKGAVQPWEKAVAGPILRSGDTAFKNFKLNSNSWSLSAQVNSLSEIEVPVFDFPLWMVWVNGQRFIHSSDNDLGRISLKLDKGDYLIEGKFKDTIIRTVSNFITLFSAVFLIFYVKRSKKTI